MKTSIELPEELLTKVREFNKLHPDRPINVSAVCRMAIEKALEKAQVTT